MLLELLQGVLESGVTVVTNYVDTLLTNAQINVALHSLIIDGIFNGVGTVLSFLPIIVTLFFFYQFSKIVVIWLV